MQKTTKRLIVSTLLFSLVTMYGSMPMAKAASFDSLKDTISDSDVSAGGVTHTIVLDSHEDLKDATAITYVFAALIDLTSASVTCPAGSTKVDTGIVGQTVTCTISEGDLAAVGGHTLTITDAVNPAVSAAYKVTVTATNVSDVTESAEALIYIIDDVVMTASVAASLTFEVAAVNSAEDVNGSDTTITSTPTTIPFGSLTAGEEEIIGQKLNVTTNAGGGFSVTVQQTGDLASAAGDDIDAAAASLATWTAPTGVLGTESTYGKMGFTTSDATLSGGTPDLFGENLYRGFDGTTAVEVMYHDGPADGTAANKGSVDVGYQVEISSLQEAGDYETTLTYICTPTF